MKRVHRMPFGAEWLAPNRARLRLWAPSVSRVEASGDEGSPAAMTAGHDGWFEHVLERAADGASYAFRIDGGQTVPDPASRFNAGEVSGPSRLVDPAAFDWPDETWTGRPWTEAVVYELHLGTFTPEGTFRAAIGRLDYLAELGITAIELMPVAAFAGRRNWGYDGVLPFAPAAAYGSPDDLKGLVAAAHARGIMMILDVVYNHFGPEGNYLPGYAAAFFNAAHPTPWGAAINFDAAGSAAVRAFFVHNALYWLEEFGFDGLRLDAVHAIVDESPLHIVTEIARAVASGPGRRRHVHLILENERNEASRLAAGPVVAQWNDDFHHALHVLLTGEEHGYYGDYAADAVRHLARALAEGFAYQGEPSAWHDGAPRGQASRHLPPACFVNFLQNHDQIGNRARGERLAHLAAPERMHLATAILLLAPAVPMLFMGEEFAASTPFLYFVDYEGDLARAVSAGRRREFEDLEDFPDPNDPPTFARSRLDWAEPARPAHRAALTLHRALLAIRHTAIVPHLAGDRHAAQHRVIEPALVVVDWTLGDGTTLGLRANFAAETARAVPAAPGTLLYETSAGPPGELAPWSGRWWIG